MKIRTAIFVAVSVALGLASPALFAQQGQEPNTPQARKAQMGSGQGQQGPGQRKMEAKSQKGSGQGQQGPGQRKMEAKAQKGSGQGQQGFGGQRKAQAQGQGQEPNTPQTARKAQMGDGQGQQGFGGQRQMQGSKGVAGGGEQFHKGGAAAKSKAAQMHK